MKAIKKSNAKPIYLILLLLTFIWSFIVVSLGAYTRLTEAGLGCPDWPGCYGFLTIPQTPQDIAQAFAAYPDAPFEKEKALNEMLHRYVAGILAILIGLIAIRAWFISHLDRHLSTLLLAVVIFQAVLGMWTVTMSLMPIVVMGHLMGGFTIVSLLFVMCWREMRRYILAKKSKALISNSLTKSSSAPLMPEKSMEIQVSKPFVRFPRYLRILSLVCVFVVAVQVMLGGWVSANYAALVCTDLPICEVDWRASYDASAFYPFVPEHQSYQYGVLNFEQRITIHATHRIGAMLVTVCILLLAFCIRRYLGQGAALGLVTLLLIQIGLGITNVLAMLPLPIAVLHHFFGLILLLTTVWIALCVWAFPAPYTRKVTTKTEGVTYG